MLAASFCLSGRHRLASGVLAALVALLLAAPPAGASSCPGADALPTAATMLAYADATACLLNEQRASLGIVALRRNAALDRAAAAYSRRMVTESFFSHVAPDGARLAGRLAAAGYFSAGRPWFVGENLAWRIGSLSTPADVIAAWMASPGHRANMLEPAFRELGIGLAAGTPGDPSAGVTVTAEFGVICDRRDTETGVPAGARQQPSGLVTPRPGSPSGRRTRAGRQAGSRRCGRP